MRNSNYHRFLRVSSVVVAFVLIFESGLLSEKTSQLSKQTHQYLANSIGATASVRPTELNMYTAELTAKERQLDAREEALAEREIAVEIPSGSSGGGSSTYVLASILFILLVLILLNYILDYLRIREERIVKTV